MGWTSWITNSVLGLLGVPRNFTEAAMKYLGISSLSATGILAYLGLPTLSVWWFLWIILPTLKVAKWVLTQYGYWPPEFLKKDKGSQSDKEEKGSDTDAKTSSEEKTENPDDKFKSD